MEIAQGVCVLCVPGIVLTTESSKVDKKGRKEGEKMSRRDVEMVETIPDIRPFGDSVTIRQLVPFLFHSVAVCALVDIQKYIDCLSIKGGCLCL